LPVTIGSPCRIYLGAQLNPNTVKNTTPVVWVNLPIARAEREDVASRSYDVYRHRDVIARPELARLRRLLTLDETRRLCALTSTTSGGSRGLASRPPSPFEQLPAPREASDDTLEIGEVQFRGVGSGQTYSLPLLQGDGEQAGVSDRAIVIAGSPAPARPTPA
jgi:hypothetical protein